MGSYWNRVSAPLAVEACDLDGQSLAAGDALEACEPGLHLRHHRLQLRFIHARGVEVPELLAVGRALRRMSGCGRLEDLAEDGLVPLLENGSGAPEASVRGNGVGRHPAAAGVLVEVLTGLRRLVERGGIEARWHRTDDCVRDPGDGLAGRRGAGRGRCRGARGDQEQEERADGAQCHGWAASWKRAATLARHRHLPRTKSTSDARSVRVAVGLRRRGR